MTSSSSPPKQFQRVLIANRGEISRRVTRACRAMGIQTVAVFTELDADMPHVKEADTAVLLGGGGYTDIAAVMAAIRLSGADAVHPGYGFLSENPQFAQAVEAEPGVTFIGPSARLISALGSKVSAKKLVSQVPDAPLLPAATSGTLDEWVRFAAEAGYPFLLKASGGGGGRGMRVVRCEADLRREMETAEAEALKEFGDGTVFMEKYLERVKHVEVQVFGDEQGNVAHFMERDCSVQRRHQKVVEEAPCAFLDGYAGLRERLLKAAVGIAKSVGYTNAGTVEFVVDVSGAGSGGVPPFYFLEVNTRLQVEHPVSELVTNTDLVKLQLLVAQGHTLAASLPLCVLNKALPVYHASHGCPIGHAVQTRLYAEDITLSPTAGDVAAFIPSAAEAATARAGEPFAAAVAAHASGGRCFGPGFSPDSARSVAYHSSVETGSTVSVAYDNMICKVVCFTLADQDGGPRRPQETRAAAVALCASALRDVVAFGPATNKLLLLTILSHPDFLDNTVTTRWLQGLCDRPTTTTAAAAAASGPFPPIQVLATAEAARGPPPPGRLTRRAFLDAASVGVATLASVNAARAAAAPHLRHVRRGWSNSVGATGRPVRTILEVSAGGLHGVFPRAVLEGARDVCVGGSGGGDDDADRDVFLESSVVPGSGAVTLTALGGLRDASSLPPHSARVELLDGEDAVGGGGVALRRVRVRRSVAGGEGGGAAVQDSWVVGIEPLATEVGGVRPVRVHVYGVASGLEVSFAAVPPLLFDERALEQAEEEPATRPSTQTDNEYVAPDPDASGAPSAAAAPGEGGKAAVVPTHRVKSPLTGKVFKVVKKSGETVEKGETVLILESMKMETVVRAPAAGKVLLSVKQDEVTKTGRLLFILH